MPFGETFDQRPHDSRWRTVLLGCFCVERISQFNFEAGGNGGFFHSSMLNNS